MFIAKPTEVKNYTDENLLRMYGKLLDEYRSTFGHLAVAEQSAEKAGANLEQETNGHTGEDDGNKQNTVHSLEEAKKLTREQLLTEYTNLHGLYTKAEQSVYDAVDAVDRAFYESGVEPDIWSSDPVEWTIAIRRAGLSDNDFE